MKFLAHPGQAGCDPGALIPIFHDWIRLKTVPGTLIDVADYRHVPDGPGIMLIGHEINYAMEQGGGQWGLSAQRKLGSSVSSAERILDLAKNLALFGSLLEADSRMEGKLQLDGGSFLFQANDRLKAPNTDEGYAALKSDLETAASQFYGGVEVTLTRVENDPRERLTALVASPGPVRLSNLAG